MRDEGIQRGARWPRHAGRRHLSAADLANDFLPRLRTGRDVRQGDRVEREPAGLRPLVVTGDAVLIDQRALGLALCLALSQALTLTQGLTLGRALTLGLTLAGCGGQHDDPRDEADPDAPDHPRSLRRAARRRLRGGNSISWRSWTSASAWT